MPDVAERAERFAGLSVVPAGLTRKLLRFGTGAIVATICSQATFLMLYGPVHASTTVSSVFAWFAGAVPNYSLNRSWTWGRRGRPSISGELVPYAAIVLGTLCMAIVATDAGAHVLSRMSVSHSEQTFLVSAIYFSVYAVMFVFRFLLFDRLFAPAEAQLEG
ncbi:MAG: GtrA family protein [Nocardioides sp.]|nr:GtrA family protein [Nocardioides sp.]